jgi:cation:H+ antiporter
MILSFLIICFSTYLIWKASESFDIASTYLTRNLNEGIKGPTVNAIASSLPELLISFFFLFYIGDIEGFSAGYATIIGSSIFNIAIIPAISFLIIFYKEGVPLFPTDKKIIEQDGFFLIITEIALFAGLYFGGISIYLAAILILLYCIYIFMIFQKRNKNASTNTSDKLGEHKEELSETTSVFKKIITIDIVGLISNHKVLNTWKAYLILFIALVIISVSCKELVTSSEHLSEQLNMNLFFITFFIAAVASSIPDTILSIKDAKNGKYKDAFSNAYGSNIFDICIGIGLPVLAYLIVNDIDVISTTSTSGTNDIVFWSSILLIVFSIPITLIYWLKSLNLLRSYLVIALYLFFLGIVFYLS